MPSVLAITWQDGSESRIATQALRTKCPCSACQTRTRSASATYLPLLSPPATTIREVNLVGSSAIQIIWEDGHANSIFSYALIRELAPPREAATR
ncbi:MAG: DUF971 domain-containing protein [Bacteroidetes bacterium]|nr:DUF971 domain-containing protein [Bacteroidota bacterium]